MEKIRKKSSGKRAGSVSLRLILCLACLLLLGGCRKKEEVHPTAGEDGVYQIYYLNSTRTGLASVSYQTETTDAEILIGELAGQFAQDDEVVREVLNAEASLSSPDAFLDDLSGAGEPVETVGWTDAVGLEHAGREVLGAYERAGASLQMHGYLDLHGTAWAAVLRGGEWVDVVSVTGSHEGAASVRVARIKAG